MDYQNTDEATRREACEQVKKIVKAIKAIKIKYYLNFSKISGEDKAIYDKLERNLEEISTSHNLNNLRVALMQEVADRYDGKPVKDMGEGNKPEPNEFLQACYGAIDAQKEAISTGRIAQAIRCQEQLKKYKERLDDCGRKEVTNYKREKFAELMQTREQIEEQIKSSNKVMKGMYKIKHVRKRIEATQIFENAKKEQVQPIKSNEMEMANT